MPPRPLACPRRASRSTRAALLLTLCFALVLAADAPASAVTRQQAAKRALTGLDSARGSGAVIVFGLTGPLRAGAHVTAGGKRDVARLRHERAYIFYEDSGPFTAYPHPGQVALVGASTGKVRVSRTIKRAPRVGGRLPAFLASSKGYRSRIYRVFERLAVTPSPVFPESPVGPFAAGSAPGSSTSQPPKANDQDVIVKQGRPKNIRLTASDTEGDLLTFEITQLPNHGTLSGQPPDVVYTPDPLYLGHDHFGFKATDGDDNSNTGHVAITVVPLGLPPVVTTSTGCTAYVEQEPAVAVDGALTVTDPDDTILDSARVRVSGNFERNDDLLFTDQNGIIGSYDDQIGVLTLTGDATVANYQAALRTVRYRNLGSGSPFSTKTIEFTANDAGNDSLPATKQICITEGTSSNNNRPTGGTSEGALEYIENDGPVPVDPEFDVSDPDSTDLASATVKFIPSQQCVDEEVPGSCGGGDPVFNYFPDQDQLAFTDQNGITGSWDSENGVLTLSGTSSLANYEAAIRSVTYENTSEDPSAAPRTVQFRLTDTTGANSTPSTRTILVTPVNDAPEVTPSDGVASYTENDPATTIDADLLAFDVDDTDLEGGQVKISSGFEAGDQLTFVDQNGVSGAYDTETGVLTLTGTASEGDYQAALRSIQFSQTGNENPAESKTIEYTVNDGDLDSVPSTKNIAVTAVNDKPVLDTSDTAGSFTENGGPVAVDPGITVADVDSTTLAGATVQVTENSSLSEDTLGFADQNGITGFYDSETGVLTLSGSASLADYETALRSVTYDNSSDNPSTATRTVSFTADDGGDTDNLSDPATRDIGITAVNDAPFVATSDGATTYIDGDDGTVVDADVSTNDVDDTNLESAVVRISTGFEAGDNLVYADQLGISGAYDTGTGELTLTGSAPLADYDTALRSIEFSHTGDPAAERSKTVEFVVNDGDLDSAAASKSIAVTAPNEKPVLDTSDTPAVFIAGGGPIAVDPGITVTDSDSPSLVGATVQITDGFSLTEDRLGFTDQNGITGFVDEETGILTLSGSASVADYETALRTVTYDNSSAEPSTETRTASFTVDDGAATNNLSDPATRAIEITAAPAP